MRLFSKERDAANDDLRRQLWEQQGVCNALPAALAVLDPAGTILIINDAWRAFTAQDGPGATAFSRDAQLGGNYLEICRSACKTHANAGEALEGLHDVLAHRIPSFLMEYTLSSSTNPARFLMSVSPLKIHGGVVVTHTDISKHRHASEPPGVELPPFTELMKHLPIAVYTSDTFGRVTYFNEAAAQLWGRRPELGRDLWCGSWRIFDPEGHPVPLEQCPMAVAIREGRPVRGRELIIERPNGGRSHILPHPHPFRDEAGVLQGAINILTDITGRRQAERDLQESRQRLEGIIESSGDGIISKTLDGVVTSWNRAAEHLFGYTAGEMLGKSISAIVPEEKWPEESGFMAQLQRGEHVSHLDTMRRGKDGRRIDVSLTISPIRNNEGRVIGAATIARDITERKHAENQAREQARLLDLASDAILVADFKTGEIVYWNQGAERLHGWTSEETLGMTFEDLLVIDRDVFQNITDGLAEKGEWSGELRERTKDGHTIIVSSRITLVRDEKDVPISMLAIHTDVTERKALETNFLRAQRLDSVGTLASGLAHDLNNILSPIIMSVPVLDGDLPPELKQKILRTILASAQRGAEIVKQVLTFARGVESRQIPVNCLHLMEEVIAIAQETFPKSIVMSGHCAGDLWPTTGDPTQLHQVLLNLAINARDAMPAGGTLSITVSNFAVDEGFASMVPDAKAGRYVLMQVTDTGTGIPKAIMDKIFDPFFTTKEIGKGTGLGLSTALGIVKNHAGFLLVDSETGRGTIFKVFIPASARGATEVDSAAPSASPAGNGEGILLVDDEESIRLVTGAMLEQAGYRVFLAADGTEAIALYAQRQDEIKLVITDASMPFLSGASLLRALRKIHAEVRVIGTSGHSEEADAQDLRHLSPHAFLIKPYEKAFLLHTIANVLRA